MKREESFKQAVLNELINCHILTAEHEENPVKALADLINWEVQVALDPAVSDEYPLPDSLYPDSKDWLAGSYKERVEWLYTMYEAKKAELAALEERCNQG